MFETRFVPKSLQPIRSNNYNNNQDKFIETSGNTKRCTSCILHNLKERVTRKGKVLTVVS